MAAQPTVFLIDDDPVVRDSFALLVQSMGYPARTYASAAEFLTDYRPEQPGCLVLDVRLPGQNGLDLLDSLTQRGVHLPVIILTGYGTIRMSVRAVKAGAVDFLEKPVEDQVLLDAIHQALEADARGRRERAWRGDIVARLEQLTPREREVLDRMVRGQANKVMAAQLHVSEKTIEFHRGKVMEKMRAESLAELVRMVVAVSQARPT